MVQQSKKFIPFNWDWKPKEIIEHAYELDWDYYFSIYGGIMNGFISWDILAACSPYFSDENWRYIASRMSLPLWFIRFFQDKLDWQILSTYQKMTIDFMREFEDKIDWNMRQIVFQKFFKENKKFEKEMGILNEEVEII